MDFKIALICWAVVSLCLFTLIGIIVFGTDEHWVIWFVVLPFFMSIKSRRDKEVPHD